MIVVGHPDYYPRFGFSTEKARFLTSPFPVEAFMAMDLVPVLWMTIRALWCTRQRSGLDVEPRTRLRTESGPFWAFDPATSIHDYSTSSADAVTTS